MQYASRLMEFKAKGVEESSLIAAFIRGVGEPAATELRKEKDLKSLTKAIEIATRFEHISLPPPEPKVEICAATVAKQATQHLDSQLTREAMEQLTAKIAELTQAQQAQTASKAEINARTFGYNTGYNNSSSRTYTPRPGGQWQQQRTTAPSGVLHCAHHGNCAHTTEQCRFIGGLVRREQQQQQQQQQPQGTRSYQNFKPRQQQYQQTQQQQQEPPAFNQGNSNSAGFSGSGNFRDRGRGRGFGGPRFPSNNNQGN